MWCYDYFIMLLYNICYFQNCGCSKCGYNVRTTRVARVPYSDICNFVPRTLYALAVGGAVVVVVLEVATKRPENFICLAGLALLIIFCFVFSKEPETVELTCINKRNSNESRVIYVALNP